MESINVTKLDERAVLPTYGSEFSAGADLYACLLEPVVIAPGEAVLIHTGLAMEIPIGYAGLIFARSGLATKQGLAPSNKVGVIDPDYCGEIMVSLFNHSKEERVVEHGERIAQLVLTPFLTASWNEVKELNETVRGAGGFGSTGTK
ncbi:MAG: dUTP diphosphatase [Lachnospiraceae bacterium]|nr:dUTP diphosphatase [Lachnospiraceae bacterium]